MSEPRHLRTRSGDTIQMPFIPADEPKEPTRAMAIFGAILVFLTIVLPIVLLAIFGAPEPRRVWVDGHWENELPRD